MVAPPTPRFNTEHSTPSKRRRTAELTATADQVYPEDIIEMLGHAEVW
ncbi:MULTISPECIES: hypothetical protein [unclassified Bradyrhizobium]|nr:MULTISPECIES: hypothetical protein [unclassified Bradyrhizobium]